MSDEVIYGADIQTIFLGACLRLDNTVRNATAHGVSEHNFKTPMQRVVWDAVETLYNEKCEINPSSVAASAKTTDIKNLTLYIITCVQAAPMTTNPDYWIDKLLDEHWQIDAVGKIDHAKKAVAQDINQDYKSIIDKIPDKPTSKGLGLNKSALQDAIELDIETRFEKFRSGESFSVTSGWPSLDKLVHGWLPETFNVVAGRPAMGKTSIGINFLINAAKAGTPVTFFTIEMSAVDLSHKIISVLSGVGLSNIIKGSLDDDELDNIHIARKAIAAMPITIIDNLKTVEDIRREATKKHRRGEADLIIIDYIQLMGSTQKFNSIREKTVHVSNSLKMLAKETGAAVMGLAQLSRNKFQQTTLNGKKQAPQKPTMQDLKESGSIEEDADTVLLLHREPYYLNGEGQNYLIIGKSRRGATGEVLFNCDLSTGQFTEKENQHVFI